nr:ankyrin repeat domain-containing protein [Wolbachia endosymbiont of Madathamugadia hiepei]
MVYFILRHCIERDSARSEEGERLSFQSVMDILSETTLRFITLEYFYGLINFRDQSRNTLLHQAVRDNNTQAIEVFFSYDINPLIKNQKGEIPLDLAQGKTRDALVKGMKKQADSKKWSAVCNSSFGVIPGVFLGVGLGVGSALAGPSMAIILGAAGVFTLVAGIAVGLAIYFLSYDYKQAKSIEKAINSEPSSALTNDKKAPVTAGGEKRQHA